MVFQNYFAKMPTPEEKLASLKTERSELETRFTEASQVIEQTRQRYAEVNGGIKALEELNSED